jgi:hypothetical protein
MMMPEQQGGAGIVPRFLNFVPDSHSGVTTQARIVRQLIPRDRMLLGAHAQEAAEGHNRIRHTTTDFLNHQALYASDVVSLRLRSDQVPFDAHCTE